MDKNHEDVIEDLGAVSELTRGLPSGIWPEQSIIPWRVCNPPGTPSCPGT